VLGELVLTVNITLPRGIGWWSVGRASVDGGISLSYNYSENITSIDLSELEQKLTPNPGEKPLEELALRYCIKERYAKSQHLRSSQS